MDEKQNTKYDKEWYENLKQYLLEQWGIDITGMTIEEMFDAVAKKSREIAEAEATDEERYDSRVRSIIYISEKFDVARGHLLALANVDIEKMRVGEIGVWLREYWNELVIDEDLRSFIANVRGYDPDEYRDKPIDESRRERTYKKAEQYMGWLAERAHEVERATKIVLLYLKETIANEQEWATARNRIFEATGIDIGVMSLYEVLYVLKARWDEFADSEGFPYPVRTYDITSSENEWGELKGYATDALYVEIGEMSLTEATRKFIKY